jgi:hypothetical protein
MNKTNDILERLSHQPQPVIDNPDELTDSIIAHLPDEGTTKEKAQGKRWVYFASAIVVAASLLLLMVFRQEKEEIMHNPAPLQLPPKGERVTHSVPLQLPQKVERTAPSVPLQLSSKVERTAPSRGRVAKTTKSSSAPHHISPKDERTATPAPSKESEVRESDFSLPSGGDGGGIVRPPVEDPYLKMASLAQDIRSRGERLHEEVAMMMENQ